MILAEGWSISYSGVGSIGDFLGECRREQGWMHGSDSMDSDGI